MDNFIEYEEDEEAGAAMDEAEREERRRERRRLVLMQSTYALPFVHCISNTLSSAWDEIYEVFGDGHDYD